MYILQNQAGQHKAEDCGDVSQGTVDLGFRGTPFVVQETGVAWTIFGFGTHTLLGSTSSILAKVLQ